MPIRRQDQKTGEMVEEGTVEYLHVAVRDLNESVGELVRRVEELEGALAGHLRRPVHGDGDD